MFLFALMPILNAHCPTNKPPLGGTNNVSGDEEVYTMARLQKKGYRRPPQRVTVISNTRPWTILDVVKPLPVGVGLVCGNM